MLFTCMNSIVECELDSVVKKTTGVQECRTYVFLSLHCIAEQRKVTYLNLPELQFPHL